MQHDANLFSTLENVVIILERAKKDLEVIVNEKNICGDICRSCMIAKQILSKVISMINFAHKANREVFYPVGNPVTVENINKATNFDPERDTI